MSDLVPTTVGSLNLEHLEATLGAFFIGYIFSMIGYGFTFFQTYVYYICYPKDHWVIRSTVALLCAIDTTTSGLESQALYHYLVELFPYTQGLRDATQSFRAENFLSVLVIFVVQMFYVSRIYNLSKNVIVAGSISLIATIGFILGVVMSVRLINDPTFSDLQESGSKGVVAGCQAMLTLSALMIFSALCFYLDPARVPGSKALSGNFNKFITFFITRAGGAALVQFLYFITFVSMPEKQIWIPFHLVVSKLFVNSLITMLNCREIFRGQGFHEETQHTMSSGHRKTGGSFGGSAIRTNPAAVRFNVGDSKPVINIEVSRTVEHDNSGKAGYDFEETQSLSEERSRDKQASYGV